MIDQLQLFDTSAVNDLTQRLVFPAAFEEQVAYRDRLAAHAREEFSEVNLCASWLRNGFGDAEFWQHLSEREQVMWLARYRHARQIADSCYRGRMASPLSVLAEEDRRFREEEAMAAAWAVEIKEAAINRQPIPFCESEEMTGFERLRFKHRLARAFQIAGVVIVEQAAEPQQANTRRRASKGGKAP